MQNERVLKAFFNRHNSNGDFEWISQAKQRKNKSTKKFKEKTTHTHRHIIDIKRYFLSLVYFLQRKMCSSEISRIVCAFIYLCEANGKERERDCYRISMCLLIKCVDTAITADDAVECRYICNAQWDQANKRAYSSLFFICSIFFFFWVFHLRASIHSSDALPLTHFEKRNTFRENHTRKISANRKWMKVPIENCIHRQNENQNNTNNNKKSIHFAVNDYTVGITKAQRTKNSSVGNVHLEIDARRQYFTNNAAPKTVLQLSTLCVCSFYFFNFFSLLTCAIAYCELKWILKIIKNPLDVCNVHGCTGSVGIGIKFKQKKNKLKPFKTIKKH